MTNVLALRFSLLVLLVLPHFALGQISKEVKIGGSFEVEAVKAVSDIYSPVSGTVSEINEALDGNEQTVNEDPHGAGWLFKVTMSDPSELDKLMDGAAYSAHADEG